MGAAWSISAALYSGKGRVRGRNEDAYFFNGEYPNAENMNDEKHLAAETEGEGSLWAICDGVGGARNGDRASRTAVRGMKDLKNHLPGRNFPACLQNWVRQADRVIAERTSGGGCTMVMLYGQENGLQMAHIGDSRIYWFHEGQLRRLTRDHSKMEMLMEAGLITEKEARTHPQRHVITRALGLSGEAFCEATIGNPMPVVDGDAYLLCSDGLTDMLPDREIERIFRETETADDCAGALYRGALEAGGKDNTTVLVLRIRAESEVPSADVGADGS